MSVADTVLEILHVLFVIITGYISALISAFFPPARKSITGETVLITGAGHGIGREFSLEIAKLGAVVVLWDINEENNKKTLEDVKKIGGRGFAYQCDITSSSQIKAVADKVRSDVGEVTILINNAGIVNGGPLLELSEADIRRTFEVNTLSHFWMIKEFLPVMIKRGTGHILNMISMAAYSGSVNLSDYCASKHAAMGLHESLTEELHKQNQHNIKLTALCPMFVDTGLIKNFKVGNHERLLTPNETALAGIDGMLRNYEMVFVPPKMNAVLRIGLMLPRKTKQYLLRQSGVEVNSQYKKDS
uniref:Short-chain dehydrogenase/reductase 3 n=1 Tax=Arion vulgaris TaxID=1028688 RepID=A0A0B7BGP2_9EUPU